MSSSQTPPSEAIARIKQLLADRKEASIQAQIVSNISRMPSMDVSHPKISVLETGESIKSGSPAVPLVGALSVQTERTERTERTENSATGSPPALSNSSNSLYPNSTNSANNNSANPEIILNSEQREFIQAVLNGESVCITGAAGTGKTTSVKTAISELLESNRIFPLETTSHKFLQGGTPGIVLTSFTNKAVSNVRKVLSADMKGNCLTLHKLLRFEPVWDENPNTGKKTVTFEPFHNIHNPLSHSIQVIIIDEASMLGVSLWNDLIRAISRKEIQIIFIGDIQQLPPVFGKSIFIHVIQQGLKVIELKKVYRQALESPILSLAHRILSGKAIPAPELQEYSKRNEEILSEVIIRPWKSSVTENIALKMMTQWLPSQIDSGAYVPMTDVILTPFNVNFGTEALNIIVASHLAKKQNAEVFEIFSGFRKKYLRVGEKVLYNKSEAVVVSIVKNPRYYGKNPRDASTTMDYSGVESDKSKLDKYYEDQMGGYASNGDDIAEVDAILDQFSNHTSEDSTTSNQASHIVVVKSADSEIESSLSTAGDINMLLLAYAQTIHKSQGSEWNRVFFITHKSQSNMWYRELLYTAVTRAKRELIIICEPNTFVKGINTQKLPGKNVEEKLEAFDRYLKVQKGMSESEKPIGLKLLGLK